MTATPLPSIEARVAPDGKVAVRLHIQRDGRWNSAWVALFALQGQVAVEHVPDLTAAEWLPLHVDKPDDPETWSPALVAAMMCPRHDEHDPHTPDECADMRAEHDEE